MTIIKKLITIKILNMIIIIFIILNSFSKVWWWFWNITSMDFFVKCLTINILLFSSSIFNSVDEVLREGFTKRKYEQKWSSSSSSSPVGGEDILAQTLHKLVHFKIVTNCLLIHKGTEQCWAKGFVSEEVSKWRGLFSNHICAFHSSYVNLCFKGLF
jgi:hypothetical protein